MAPPETVRARSRCVPLLSFLFPPSRSASLRECDAKRLEDRFEDVLRVFSLDEPHVQRETRGLCKLLEKASSQISGEPRDPRLREVHVRDEQGPSGCLERHVRERLVGRNDRRAVTPSTVSAERLVQGFAERPRGRGDLELRRTRLDVER